MRKYNLLLIFILGLLMIHVVSAEIIISQPNSLYNLGDEFSVDFQVDEFKEDYFDANLICQGESINLFHGILTAEILQITRKLIPSYIENLNGNCYLEAIYGVDIRTSQEFEISDELIVNLELREITYKAGEDVIIKGQVHKNSRGELIQEPNPSVEIILGGESKTTGIVKEGKFEVNFSTHSDLASGNYDLEVFVYEKDSEGNLLNKGKAHILLTITQEPDHLDIAMESQVVDPGQNIIIVPIIYDRAEMQINGEDMVLKILDVFDNVIYEKLVVSGGDVSLDISTDHAPGHSKIIVEKDEMIVEKLFDVQENQMVNVIIENRTMKVINIGNVPYKKPVEIEIGSEIVLKKLDLRLGESQSYYLSAPTGDYEVIIRSGEGLLHSGQVSLTGDAISVEEVKQGAIRVAKSPIAWMFILVVIVLTIFVVYKNHRKKKQYSFPITPLKKPAKTKEELVEVIEKTEKSIKDKDILITNENVIKPGSVKRAEKVLVLSGEKQGCGVVCLKIKNDIKSQICKQTLNKAFNSAYDEKGAVAKIDGGFLIIFSPLVTRTSKNSEKAIKVGHEIEAAIKEHNKKFKDKIEFGIGVVSSEIINQVREGVLKFTEMGNRIKLCKKIAESSDSETLVSQEAHDQTRSNVKVERAQDLSQKIGAGVYRIKKIKIQERKSEFIRSFLNRNKKSK